MANQCEYFTFLNFDEEALLLWNFLEGWEMLMSGKPSSFSSSGTGENTAKTSL